MMRRQVTAALFLATVTAAAIGIVGLVAEWYLRTTVPVDWTQEYRIPHPLLGWTLAAGSRYTTYVPEPVVVSYNSEGWRDIEPDGRLDADLRVAILGDSFVEAYSVERDESVSSRLGALIKTSGRDGEVFNFGVGGYGTLQEYLVYQQIASTYRPHLVLLGFYLGNDVRNNDLRLESVLNTGQAKIESRPFLTLGSSGMRSITPVDITEARKQTEFERARREQWPLRDARKSVLFRVLGRTVRRLAGNVVSSDGTDSLVTQQEELGEVSRFGVHFCEEPEEITSAWTLTTVLLEQLRDAVRANGARLVVFTVPAQEEVHKASMEAALARFAHPERFCFERAPGYQRLHGVLDALGIESVDLLPTFRDAAREENAMLFRDDRHWGPTGHALAAEFVFRELHRRQLLP